MDCRLAMPALHLPMSCICIWGDISVHARSDNAAVIAHTFTVSGTAHNMSETVWDRPYLVRQHHISICVW